MTNEQARTLTLPLAFLGKGAWTATIWADGDAPTDVRKRAQAVDPSATLTLALSSGGGAVVKVSPVE